MSASLPSLPLSPEARLTLAESVGEALMVPEGHPYYRRILKRIYMDAANSPNGQDCLKGYAAVEQFIGKLQAWIMEQGPNSRPFSSSLFHHLNSHEQDIMLAELAPEAPEDIVSATRTYRNVKIHLPARKHLTYAAAILSGLSALHLTHKALDTTLPTLRGRVQAVGTELNNQTAQEENQIKELTEGTGNDQELRQQIKHTQHLMTRLENEQKQLRNELFHHPIEQREFMLFLALVTLTAGMLSTNFVISEGRIEMDKCWLTNHINAERVVHSIDGIIRPSVFEILVDSSLKEVAIELEGNIEQVLKNVASQYAKEKPALRRADAHRS